MACLATALVPAPASAASPELSDVQPAGVQRGTDATVTFVGKRLGDAADVLFYRRGITLKELKAEKNNRVTAHLSIAADCPLGEHPLRLLTATGISELRTLWVGAMPVVNEAEPNSDFDQPQPIDLNTTISGVVKSEDVDYFVVEAKAGQRITAEVEAIRLGRAMFDPYVAILDAKRFELAAVDDTALLRQDAVASAIAPEDGRYIIELRDASYGGANNYHYRLHVGTFPRPTVALPPGGQPGQPTELTLLGDVAGPMPLSQTLPEDGPETMALFPEDEAGIAPSPVWLRVNALPVAIETEDNHTRKTATPSPVPPPVALHGVIDTPGQPDFFRFPAKKDQTLEARVYARQLGSPLDAVLNVFQAGGKHIGGNDDTAGLDSVYRFKVPADGEYELRIRDMLDAGGPTFVYRVEVVEVTPALSVALVQEDTNRPQSRQTIPVPQGNRYAARVRIERNDVSGEVTLTAPKLPPGVTMHAPPVAGNQREVPVVFEAAADATPGGGLFPLQGTIKREAGDVVGGFHQDVPLVIAAPNRTVYYELAVNQLAVAVTEAAPFSIELVPPKVPLVLDGTGSLEVVAKRAEGFDKPITLRMLWNPPGVGSAGSVTIEPDQTTASYPLNAAGNAEVRPWQVCVVAEADTGQGNVWTASQLVDLTVAEPFVRGQIQMAAVDQGQPVPVVCTLEQLQTFEDEAVVRLIGLPAKAAAEERKITAADEQVVFEVTTAADTPAGQHKGLFCEVVVMQDGEPIVHRIAHGGVLRVDKPRPTEKPAAKVEEKPKPKEEAKPAAPKPLSRLEQLRQQSAEPAEGEAK